MQVLTLVAPQQEAQVGLARAEVPLRRVHLPGLQRDVPGDRVQGPHQLHLGGSEVPKVVRRILVPYPATMLTCML